MKYSAHDIARIFGLNIEISDGAPIVQYICVDTRSILRPASTLFVALPGKHKDGHDFIESAYKRGVRHFVVDRPISNISDSIQYVVSDTLQALQQLAMAYRQQFDIPVIGITGSNGKTTVKEWIAQLVSGHIPTHKSPLSYNSQIGVPLSLFGLRPDHQIAVLEAGISQMGEMERLSPMINCSIGVFTTLGDAHSAGFDSELDKLKEKLKLFHSANTIIYNRDQQRVEDELKHQFPEKELISISLESDQADYYIYKSERKIKLTNKNNVYILPFSNPHETGLKNIAMAIAAVHHAGIDIDDLIPTIEEIDEVPMRMQLDYGANGSVIIDDGYNADLQSFESALGFMQLHAGIKTRKLILSEFGEIKNNSKLNEELGSLISNYKIGEVFAVGSKIKSLSNHLPPEIIIHHFNSVQDLMSSDKLIAHPNDIILIKGARSYHLEAVHRRLSAKMHRTVLEIDLEALGHNLSCHAQLLRPSTKIMAMVKASAYGSGIEEIANYLSFRQVDYFGVAYIDEGITLRKSGISTPILVLTPMIENLERMIQYKLEPSINSIQDLNDLINLLGPDRNCGIHVNIDTGMNRSGINPSEVEALRSLILHNNQVHVISLYSHLVAADDPDFKDFTHAQILLFSEISDQITTQMKYQPMRHILNSHGLLHYASHQMDLVRLGIGLYGVQNAEINKEKLMPVHTLKSHISHIQDLDIGESVGYNRSWRAHRLSRIATIQIGYADGLPRSSGQHGYQVRIGDQLAPIVGHVCMDLTMIDVTDLQDIRIGDEVIIYGQGLPISDLAKANDTISYEILSNISERVKRIYLR